MKWYTKIAAAVLLLVLVGCGGNMYQTSDTQDENTETTDNNITDSSDGEEDPIVEDTDSELGQDDPGTEDSNDEQGEEPNTEDNDDGDKDNMSESESDLDLDEDGTTQDAVSDESTAIEFALPEDTTTYDTGLVFVKQEDDIWRVVDRMGNVYRVSTSYTPISAGTVAEVAHVSENEDGDVQVELEQGFIQHENAVVIEGNPDVIPREFVTDLLNQTTSILDYRIRDVSVKTRGKGMLVVTMKYDVKPENVDGEWPSVDESNYTQLMKYQFVVYGYDTTWVIPTYPSLIDGSVLDDGHDTSVNRNQSPSSDSQQVDSTDTSSAEGKQIVLYEAGNKHYYYVQEKEKQSQRLQGSNIYEYTSILYSESDGKRLPLTSGLKNTDYKVLKVQNGHIYLLQEAWEPNSESFPSGIGVIDIEANSYNRLHQGPVKEAATTSQNIYLFGTDALYAIDVVNSRLLTIADLPETMNFRMHNMNVIGIENNVMEVSVDGDRGTENYAINLGTGDIVNITQ